MRGFCSNCHRVWTLETGQGICRWCARNAYCATTTTTPRHAHSKRTSRSKQAHSGGNGYDGLPEPWYTYHKVGMRYAYKAMTGDRDDLLHSIIEGLASVAQHKADKGEDFTEPAMYRTAEHIKDAYWYRHYAYHNGLDCRHCSKEQRAKCRYNWSHSEWAYTDCHRVIQLESLNQPITDNEGSITELADVIADDKALDLAEWVDARTFLIGAPVRLKAVAVKRNRGQTLTDAERKYLSRLRRKQQKVLAGVTF